MSFNPRRLGKYELGEFLGRGGMAEVWKAFDTQLKRFVAIKILRTDLQAEPELVHRFEREAQVIASLHHPNIVQIYDYNVARPPEAESTSFYMVMNYVEGQTLAEFIQHTSRAGNFPSPVTIVDLFTLISLAVDFSHQKGMIHRDIKPSNILLDKHNTSHLPMGEPILSDFGIVKILNGSTKTLSNWWVGTPHYTSPEQVMGAPGNERSDIYALGIILFEICTGILPFQGTTPTEIMMQQINAAPPAPILVNPAIPPTLAGVILRALAKEPALRFPTASAMAAALAEAFNMPIPKVLDSPNSLSEDAMDSPTYRNPLLPPLHPSVKPGSASWHSISPVSSPAISGQQPPIKVISEHAAPKNPPNTPHVSAIPQSNAQLPPITSLQPITGRIGSPLSPTVQQRRRRGLFIGLLAALIIVLLGSGLNIFFIQRVTPSPSTKTDILGHGYITSSDQVDPTNSQGVNDQLLLDLSNIVAPPSGMAYYAWLLNDKGQLDTSPFLLGKVSVNQGHVHLSYIDEQHHTNVLTSNSRILLTQEAADVIPMSPTPNQHAWRYYAELPQSPNPQDTMGHSSQLTHLRHLLSQDPWIQSLGLNGGLASWMTRNAQKMQEWTVSARDDWGNPGQIPFMRRQFIRTIEYIDGSTIAQKDLPPGTSPLVDPKTVSVGLLGMDLSDKQHPDTFQSWMLNMKQPATAGYLYDVSSHLAAVIWSPGATEAQKTQAWNIDTGLNHMRADYEQVRKDAIQLLAMTDEQLQQPTTLTLLNDMTNHANNAYVGQYDPTGQRGQPGALNIYHNIQALATFDIRPYKPV